MGGVSIQLLAQHLDACGATRTDTCLALFRVICLPVLCRSSARRLARRGTVCKVNRDGARRSSGICTTFHGIRVSASLLRDGQRDLEESLRPDQIGLELWTERIAMPRRTSDLFAALVQ